MIVFVVPAYNEEQNIGRLIGETDAHMRGKGLAYRLVVVDDGSSDGTAGIVRGLSASLPCEVVSYSPNKGVGEAFRRGLRRALEIASDDDVIVTKEADSTSDLAILDDLLAKIADGCDVALASCYADGGRIEGTTPFRMFLSRCANAMIDSAFHIKGIHTYSSFYRAHKPQALKKVLAKYGDFYAEPGFACVIELLVRFAKLRLRIEEVPMTLRSTKRVGKSKMKVFRTVLGYFRVTARNLFS